MLIGSQDICKLAVGMPPLPSGIVLPVSPDVQCEWRDEPNSCHGASGPSTNESVAQSPHGQCPIVTFSGDIGGDRALRSATPWTFCPFEKPERPPTAFDIYKKRVRKKVAAENPSLSRPRLNALIRSRFTHKEAGGPSRAEERDLKMKERQLREAYEDELSSLRRAAWSNASLLQPLLSAGSGITLAPLRYWEVTLSEAPMGEAEAEGGEWCVAVGFCSWKFRLHGRMPGWDGRSVACHSDDGQAFHNHETWNLGLKFKAGDTVGVGLRLDDGDPAVFFTHNGEFHSWLGRLELMILGKTYDEISHNQIVNLFPVFPQPPTLYHKP